jgi:hypothetical protein
MIDGRVDVHLDLSKHVAIQIGVVDQWRRARGRATVTEIPDVLEGRTRQSRAGSVELTRDGRAVPLVASVACRGGVGPAENQYKDAQPREAFQHAFFSFRVGTGKIEHKKTTVKHKFRSVNRIHRLESGLFYANS